MNPAHVGRLHVENLVQEKYHRQFAEGQGNEVEDSRSKVELAPMVSPLSFTSVTRIICERRYLQQLRIPYETMEGYSQMCLSHSISQGKSCRSAQWQYTNPLDVKQP